jgi:hypothetical protein
MKLLRMKNVKGFMLVIKLADDLMMIRDTVRGII